MVWWADEVTRSCCLACVRVWGRNERGGERWDEVKGGCRASQFG